MLIQASQIDPASLALAIQRAASGAAFSGNMVNYAINSGYMGPTVLWVTGGAQDVTGVKTFLDSPRVPYSGTTGSAPSARWVNDQIAATSSASISALSGYVQGASGALSYVRVTGSATIGAANLTGMNGISVFQSGQYIVITGGAGGAGGAATGSNVSVTGSSTLSNVGLTGGGGVVVSYVVETGPGAAAPYVLISGSVGADSTLSGYVEGNFVHRGAVDELVSGIKVFTGSPQVPNPTLPSGAANLSWVSGVSGVLQAAIGSAAPVTNVYNLSGITGNFVNMSWYFDQYNLTTGLNSVESMVGRSFFFTGYGLGAINTGTQGWFSGSFYQRTQTNAKTNFVDFYLNSGMFFSGRGGFSQEVSGLNRVGLDIYLIGTGITGLTVGLFGVGY